jgi:hypothetical protein
MSKSYTGERIPGTVNYHVFVTEGKQKKEILIDQQLNIQAFVADVHLTHRNELAYKIALAILIDFTGNVGMAEACFRDFKNNMERLFSEDHWLLHSNRIEAFLSHEQGSEEEIADYSFFEPIAEIVKDKTSSIVF